MVMIPQRLRWILAASAVVALAGMGRNEARADIAYGYATQSVTFKVTPGAGTISGGTQTARTGDSAVLSPGGSESMLGTNDALQSYIGSSRPPENSFGPIGMVNPNYAHGDTLISSQNLFGAGFTAQSVAESYLTSGAGNADGNWHFAQLFTVSSATDTKLNFVYSYSNTITGAVTGIGTADSTYAVDITINNVTTGTTVLVFNNAPISELNHSLSSPPSFTLSDSDPNHQFDTGNLFRAGQTYQLLISGSTTVNTAVPEPSSLALIGLGLAGTFGFVRLRKRSAAPAELGPGAEDSDEA